MKYSTKLSDAVHIMAFIALNPNELLSSEKIAESVKTNPGCIRQIMSVLRRHKLIVSVKGHPRPALAREADEISLLDIYKAVEGKKPLLHLDTHINPECGVGVNIQLALQDYYERIQQCVEMEMQHISLADILNRYHEQLSHLDKGRMPIQ